MSSSMQPNQEVPRQCIHTKHVYALMDTPKKEESFKKLSKHLETCRSCSEEFSKFQVKTLAARVYIPKALMDHDLRQSFEREVGELFKVMDLNNRELLKKSVKKGFLFVDSLGVDLLKNLASKTMMKTYLMAFFIFIFLKLFL